MNTNQLKLDKFWSRDAPPPAGPPKSFLFSKPNENKGFPPSAPSTAASSTHRTEWKPIQRPVVLQPLTKNTPATTSMRTIQVIDLTMVPPAPTGTLKHMQSAQNLFSIGKRMPEIEIALKQLVANMETCPRAEEEAPQPLSLRNVTLHGYQRHALAWMRWRESNPPFGGKEFRSERERKFIWIV